jgi:hypothetical protein
MKKIPFAALLLLSLMVCVTSTAWAGALDDAHKIRGIFYED